MRIVTLTTDFGLCDAYVAEMKAVLLSHAPGVRIVDVSHGVAPQDVLGGAIILERAIRSFPPGTVHIAVIDPGVGTDRRILMIPIHKQWVICPDNGLITWAWRRLEHPARVYELTWKPPGRASRTFHGRDIMAPAAARLAAGERPDRLGEPGIVPVLLDIAPATSLEEGGQIIHIDHFGNATTNIPAEVLEGTSTASIQIGRRKVPVRGTYADVAVGKPLALTGSSGLLEIAVRNGNAARDLQLSVGDRIRAKEERH